MNRLSLEILQGRDTHSWLNLQSNIDSWNLLFQACTWRLPFFTPNFFILWVKHYAPAWNPVLVLGRNADGQLAGLMPLAQRDHLLTGIGAQQAEYHGWLSSPKDSERFLKVSLEALFDTFPSCYLRLRFLPPRIPSQSVVDVCRQFPHVVTSVHYRPLLELDNVSIERVLRKKSNRSKINRLNRLGKLGFSKIVDIDQAEAHINRIIEFYDFRQGAINDSTPFSEDPHKRAFLLDWIHRSPDALHLFCMTLNEKLIAAYIGVNSAEENHLAILAYSPEFALFSPGKLQIYKTGQMLCNEGKLRLDLTPGGDPWKERFATHHDEVLELNAYASAAEARREKILCKFNHIIRAGLVKLHLPPSRLKSWLKGFRQLNPTSLMTLLRSVRPRQHNILLYRLKIENAIFSSTNNNAETNALNHLLSYRQTPTGKPKRVFLAEALSNLEAGQKSYSALDQADRLACCVWLARNRNQTFIEELDRNVRYPSCGAFIYSDFNAHDEYSRQCYGHAIGKALQDLKLSSDTETVYMHIDSDNDWLRQLIEKFGFKRIGGLYLTRFLWYKRGGDGFQLEEDSE